jgi:hypothetical protein
MILEVVISIILWLGLGGAAFQDAVTETEVDLRGGLLIFCVVLAPFAFGASVAEHMVKRAKLKAAKDAK